MFVYAGSLDSLLESPCIDQRCSYMRAKYWHFIGFCNFLGMESCYKC